MTKILPLFKTEYDLAKALVKKDARAYHWFYEKYSAKLLAISFRYINDRMAAEDVMVEGIMKIFDKVPQFNFNGSFEGWFKRIMVNESLNYLRKNKADEINLEDNHFLAPATEEAHNLEEEDLLKVINDLPLGFRTVFNLFAIEGYSHAEIAEKLGITEGTSKSQLSRARAILQEKIKITSNTKSDA